MKKCVRIFKPVKTAMQSGKSKTKSWVVAFVDQCEQYRDSLVGWTASTSTHHQVCLSFDTVEKAVQYAESQGWDYVVEKPSIRRVKPKAYAENFQRRMI